MNYWSLWQTGYPEAGGIGARVQLNCEARRPMAAPSVPDPEESLSLQKTRYTRTMVVMKSVIQPTGGHVTVVMIRV